MSYLKAKKGEECVVKPQKIEATFGKHIAKKIKYTVYNMYMMYIHTFLYFIHVILHNKNTCIALIHKKEL